MNAETRQALHALFDIRARQRIAAEPNPGPTCTACGIDNESLNPGCHVCYGRHHGRKRRAARLR